MANEPTSEAEREILAKLAAGNNPNPLKTLRAAKQRYKKELGRLLEVYKVDWRLTAYTVADVVEKEVLEYCPELEAFLQEWQERTKERMQNAINDHLASLP